MVVLANETITMPKVLQDTIDDCNNRLDNLIDDELEFYDSELPVKHGVASDIVRLFRDMDNFKNVIRISNLEFSFIEKTDGLRYYETEDDKFVYHIMVITGNRVGEVEALIVKKVEKKEELKNG